MDCLLTYLDDHAQYLDFITLQFKMVFHELRRQDAESSPRSDGQ
jgi:hypothetical protein